MNRRSFVKYSAGTAAGVTILNFPIFGNQAPSNKVTVAVMGVNSRGAYLAESFASFVDVDVACICDVEDSAIANGLKPFTSSSRKPEVVRDIRQLVERKDLDAIIIAAPDHWHTPASLLATTHGKHVYVEKPCGHNPNEGELLIMAAKKTRKIIQMGNQRRSFPTLIEAASLVKEGIIGNPYLAKAWYTNNRKAIGVGKQIPVPKTLDFELWQGPAPRQPFRDNLVHYNWHWFWNWGTGEACNNGTHEIDCCRWFLDVDYPSTVNSSGGRFAFHDDWQTPDTQIASFQFKENKAITWEGRSCNNYPVEGSGRGFIIYGDGGTLINSGGGDYKIIDPDNKIIKNVKPDTKVDPTNPVNPNGDSDLLHFHNFIKAVKGEETQHSVIEEAHKSVLLCHLANIAHRTGEQLECDHTNGHIKNNPKASKFWARNYEKGWEPVL
ncbi:MAG TPA: Gfo/Idh/MocA family oxidoreductase [Flavitalea sp.]|nr:Gfo/Idh/MocA family oxidoreductase [Flavitalea sp.]